MDKLVFATNNPHKLKEISTKLESTFQIQSLKEINVFEDIPEDHFTLEENAFQKAEYIYGKTGLSCFADDTGLEVDALDGQPGVFSARFSRMGDIQYPDMEVAEGNIRKLLEMMNGVKERNARFRTVIALILDGKRYSFEGSVEGMITPVKAGSEGFGYDPVFKPSGYDITFAEMDLEEKNRISHRALAVNKLVSFLKTNPYQPL